MEGLGVEVEIAEMTESRATLAANFHDLHGPFDKKVYMGASICPELTESDKTQYVGSFGGYLSAKTADQEEILLALTCDHVCFDKSRPCKGKLLRILLLCKSNTVAQNGCQEILLIQELPLTHRIEWPLLAPLICQRRLISSMQ